MLSVDSFGIISITIRSVKKGEQLMHSIYPEILLKSRVIRNELLWKERKLICNCTRCQGITATPVQRQRLTSDPDFRYIASRNTTLEMHNVDEVQAMTAKCLAFLNRYGHVEWCDQIAIAVDAYAHILNTKYMSPCNNEFLEAQVGIQLS